MSISTLVVVRPLVVTPTMLVSTTVPEDDHPEWSSATTYAQGARVIVTSQHKVYQSNEAGNVNKNPATDRVAWAEVGPTNRWKAFDTSNGTQTTRPSAISYRIKPGQIITSVAALNLSGASSIRVRVIDPTLGTLYDKTTPLAGRMLESNWWDFFFGPRTEPRQSISLDLPSVPNGDILIDLVGTASLAVGALILGQARRFSMGVKKGARIGIQDFSRKETNAYGDTVFVVRAFARQARFSMMLEASEVDAFYDFLSDVRATPCLWIGSNRYEATTIYGWFESFEILLSYFDYSDCELELKGLT